MSKKWGGTANSFALARIKEFFDFCEGVFLKNMSIKPKCDKCGEELKEFGGILLSPPDIDRRVIKYHLCKNCYEEIENLLAANKK